MSVRAGRFVDALGAVAAAANESASAEEAFRTALGEVCDAAGWPVGHTYAVTPDGLVDIGTWHLSDAARFEAVRRALTGARTALDRGPAGRAVATGAPERADDVTSDPAFAAGDAAGRAGLRCAYAIPVLVGTEVVAVLEFLFPDAGPEDPELPLALEAVGIVLGRVVERARAEDTLRTLREEIEDRGPEVAARPRGESEGEPVRDPLTGLFSSAFLEESLTMEVMRAGRSRRAVAVVALGVTAQSSVAGDRLLKAVAEFLQGRVRSGDILARHGDAFVIVLPGVSIGMGKARAQQVRKGLDEFRLEGQEDATIAASAGLACFPEHGATADTLLGGVTDALHKAMAEGGGRVETAKVSHEKWTGKR